MYMMCILTLPSLLHYSHFLCNTPSSTEIYTLSLHDALPIYLYAYGLDRGGIDERWFASTIPAANEGRVPDEGFSYVVDRKSTRLNSSHVRISYAVFCLKKKNN